MNTSCDGNGNCLSVVISSGGGGTCFDMMQNNQETGVDCGGPCLKCPGAPCNFGGECKSLMCVASMCK